MDAEKRKQQLPIYDKSECEWCKCVFEHAHGKKYRFCSHTCKYSFIYLKKHTQDDDGNEKWYTARWKDPIYVKKYSELMISSHNTESSLENHRNATKKKWESDDYRDKVTKRMNDTDVKEKKAKSMKSTVSTTESKKRYSDAQKKKWENAEYANTID